MYHHIFFDIKLHVIQQLSSSRSIYKLPLTISSGTLTPRPFPFLSSNKNVYHINQIHIQNPSKPNSQILKNSVKIMGFPVGYTEILLPKLLFNALFILGFLRSTLLTIFRLLGLSDFLEPDIVWPDRPISVPHHHHHHHESQQSTSVSVSAELIREMLPVVKFSEMVADCGGVELPESCAVCLCDFEGEEEIRRLTNCRHIFHRSCLDRWMDHDQKTCPLCRTRFVPDDMQEAFNQRLWAASGIPDFYGDYSPITNFL
ncbi:Homeobox protein B-H1 [Dionaea muscipula]